MSQFLHKFTTRHSLVYLPQLPENLDIRTSMPKYCTFSEIKMDTEFCNLTKIAQQSYNLFFMLLELWIYEGLVSLCAEPRCGGLGKKTKGGGPDYLLPLGHFLCKCCCTSLCRFVRREFARGRHRQPHLPSLTETLAVDSVKPQVWR